MTRKHSQVTVTKYANGHTARYNSLADAVESLLLEYPGMVMDSNETRMFVWATEDEDARAVAYITIE